MTDNTGSTPPFPGFPGFPPAEMLDRMWGMMRLTPSGAAFPGAPAGATQGFVPSLSMMSDMMAPLTNVEELDKRITDMRAVEQWLKLNLNMLQSAIQALEVQRATLATLRAFGAFAQQTMTQPAPEVTPRQPEPKAAASEPEAEASESATPAFDASGWWNLLQAQFNQIAQFAMAQPPSTTATGASEAGAGIEPSDLETDDAPDDASEADTQGAASAKSGDAPRPAAKRATGTKRTNTSSTKKTSSTSE
ncbi:PhaM family polyhydroxyalkanoate granule multifunctional regulatory protein [Paraburkholderia sp. C35]|uniref:PhaM family polyhydroxyalkanoate granule multifunctional regulatory protein n=1 Tax=Paraburkholderia sp. C35 TaxID=2126993 RepID=UPI000D6913F3|nr:PhaM family polyhydroxyalkanoate granule multifunctional regulatory protein [Paraburkholderia sp. C35]